MSTGYERPALTVGELRARLAELPEDLLITSSEFDFDKMGSYTRFLSGVTTHTPASPTSTDRGEVSFLFGLTGRDRWEPDEYDSSDDEDA